MTLLYIIFTTIAISLLSLVGIFALLIREELLKKLLYPLVAFAAGSLLAGAFFHLIPEAIESGLESALVFGAVLVGFGIFFFLEQFIHWHHCHKTPGEHTAPVTALVLIADGVHNFIGGIAIASGFLVSPQLGLVTAAVEAAHEIPQELGDFGVLVHGGWTKAKALVFNLLSGLAMVLGGIVTYFMAGLVEPPLLLAFSAGNFLYIAASDLIPEVKRHEKLSQALLHFGAFVLGLVLIGGIGRLFE